MKRYLIYKDIFYLYNRYILNKECTSAIDVWKVTTDEKEHFIFQTIGKLDSKAIQFDIPKEDLFNC